MRISSKRMTTLSSVAGAVGRGSLNVAVNTVIAFWINGNMFNTGIQSRDLAIIVAIDTAFRIAITHVLDALKIPFLEKGTAGHLLFPCLTLLTQRLSIKTAQRLFNTDPYLSKKENHFALFGFIALGWKANMMIKDVLYLTGIQKA